MAEDAAQSRMIRKAMKAPYLERDEEHELAVQWKENRDQHALHRIASAHMRLVISMAAKFRNYGLPFSDLIQEVHVGLLEAAARFEPDREVRFSTYATWWIRASIQDYVLRNWSIVRGGTSSSQKALFFNLRRLRAKLSGMEADVPRATLHRQISETLRVSQKDVEMMDSRLSGSDVSLNITAGPDDTGTEHMEFLVSEAPGPEELAQQSIDSERQVRWLYSALNVLNDRELHIIKQRRLTEDGVTLEALGEELGISKERVRQIEARALSKLHTALERSDPHIAHHYAAQA